MTKRIFSNTTLTCILQSEAIHQDNCLHGVISKTQDGFRFEEAVKSRLSKRNPKLFSGNYCSLVHMQNGRYQIHMKTINASAITDHKELAYKVYTELLNAFEIIN